MPFGDAAPEEVKDVLGLPQGGGTLQVEGGGYLESGSFLKAVDGERYYYGNAGDYAIYLQTRTNERIPAYYQGRFFLQKKYGFVEDVHYGGYASEGLRRTSATQSVLKSFLDIYMGALACAGGPLAWSITGMNLFVMTGQVVQNYRKYEDALVSLLSSRKTIRDRMPTLYRTVLWELYFSVLESKLVGKSKDILADAIPGPKVAGKLVGVLLGAMGEDGLSSCLKAMKELLNEVLVKVASHAMEHNQSLGSTKLVLSEEQIALLAEKHILRILKQVNRPLPVVLPRLDEAKEIVRETVRNWNLRTDFKRMADGLDALG